MDDPAPPTASRRLGGDVPLFVQHAGTGPTVVVVHGGPGFDQEYLRPELEGLAAAHRVVFYDQRGRGRSWIEGARPVATLATEVADLERVRVACGVEAMAVVGHSWGGLVALAHAVAHPDRVSHLAPRLRARQGGELGLHVGVSRPTPPFHRLHDAATIRDAELLDALVARLRLACTPAGLRDARAIEAQLLADTWARPDHDLLPSLRELAVPTLAVHGEDDLVPRAVVDEIVATIPGARLVVLPGGHFSSLEHPDLVRATITAFLAGPPG